MRKRIIILACAVLLVVLAWSGAWLFIAGQVRQQIDALALADGETNPRLTCGTLTVSGYPFRFDVECDALALTSGDLLVSAPALRASVMVYKPNHLIASAIGPVEIADAFTGMKQEVSFKDIEGSFRLESWRIERFSILANEVAWKDKLFGDTLIAQSPHVELHLLDIPEQHDATTHRASLAGYLKIDSIAAPTIQLADTNAEVELEMSALPDDIRNWGAVPFLPDWQQAGGKLTISGIRANDSTADLNATGELSLDAQGYPTGKIDIDSKGVAERIGPLIEEPWRTLVLGTPGQDGRHHNQLNFAGGGVSSGLVPIAAVPSLF